MLFIRENKREHYQTSCLMNMNFFSIKKDITGIFYLRSVNIIFHEKTIVPTLLKKI